MARSRLLDIRRTSRPGYRTLSFLLERLIESMTIEQTLLQEIEESKKWIECTLDDSTYKRDLYKRIELINWTLENMNIRDTFICEVIESKNE